MRVENNNKAFAYRIYRHFTQQCTRSGPKTRLKRILVSKAAWFQVEFKIPSKRVGNFYSDFSALDFQQHKRELLVSAMPSSDNICFVYLF